MLGNMCVTCMCADGRMLLAYQVVVAVAAYQLTSALLSQLPLNDVRACS